MNYGEIYIIKIPDSNGHEQIGLRPAIIFQEPDINLPTVIIIPCTSQEKALNYINNYNKKQ